ncbi:MAG: 4Fe-4S dicluster domain-containing protein [bacterium]
MEKFILTINKNKLRVYEIKDQCNYDLFKIFGEEYLELDPTDIEYCFITLKDYLLQILNYNNFSSINLYVVYDSMEIKTLNFLKKIFSSSNKLELQNFKEFITLLIQKNKLLNPGDRKVISFRANRWLIKITKYNEIIVSKSKKEEVDIKFKDNLIPAVITNDFSYKTPKIKQSEDIVDIRFVETVETNNRPEWQADECIQCTYCSQICPCQAIRPFLLNEEEVANAPKGFIFTRYALGESLRGLKLRFQVNPMGCMGCGACVEICPAKNKALIMKPKDSQVKEKDNWEYAINKVRLKEDIMTKYTIKGKPVPKGYDINK